MNYFSLLMKAALVLSLAACGGGSDGGGPGGGTGSGSNGGGAGGGDGGTQAPATKLNETPQVVEYHGDSTIWGYRSGTNAERIPVEVRAPEVFSSALQNRHQVRNLGRNATTVCDLLDGTGAYQIEGSDFAPQPAWREHLNNSDATVVIINHGINDMSDGEQRYRECLNQVVDIAQEAGKVVILETPNPVTDDRIGNFVSVMLEVAQQQDTYLIDQYAHLEDAFAQDYQSVAPDGTHPSEETYVEKGQFAAARFATFDSP